MGKVSACFHLDDSVSAMSMYNEGVVDFIYADIPYNTGKDQVGAYDNTPSAREFNKGKRSRLTYKDRMSHERYKTWVLSCLNESFRILRKPTGVLAIQADWRESHYIKIWCDHVFGRHNFINEIIWAYDYGARQTTCWPRKHDVILLYGTCKDKKQVLNGVGYVFRADEYNKIRIPRLAPGLIRKDDPKREEKMSGKTLTDVWFHTVVSPGGKEKKRGFGYPTQKPVNMLERLVKVHTWEEDVCLDFCAGSGSFVEACLKNERSIIAIDNNPQALRVMAERFSGDRLFEGCGIRQKDLKMCWVLNKKEMSLNTMKKLVPEMAVALRKPERK